MTYFWHSEEQDSRGVTRSITFRSTQGGSLRAGVSDDLHDTNVGSYPVDIPRDRVPDLIAALQRFMEETK